MINDSTQLECLFGTSFAKYRKEQHLCKMHINQTVDPEYADADDPESIIDSFNAQIEKIKQMCIIQDDRSIEDITEDQCNFDFPSNKVLLEIMKYLSNSIELMVIPADLIMDSLIFIFLDKILQNEYFYDDKSIISQAMRLYASISLYDYCEPMDSIIDKYQIFLTNTYKKQIIVDENEKAIFVFALSNLVIDEISRSKLISLEIHNIIYQILIQQQILSPLFYHSLIYLINFANCFDSDEKNDSFFMELLLFLIENIITNFSPQLDQNLPIEEEEINTDEDEAITVLIKELKLISILDPLIEFGLSNELENCINLLLTLSSTNYKYVCISKYLFYIMKFIGITSNNQSEIFLNPSFLDIFFNIYKESSIDAKIQGIQLMIILSSLISDNTDFFRLILQNFQDSTLDCNFESWRNITFYVITVLSNLDITKRRESIDQNLINILTYSIESQIFVSDTLKMFASAREDDPDFWDNFLNENGFITIISEMKIDEAEDEELAQLIKLIC